MRTFSSATLAIAAFSLCTSQLHADPPGPVTACASDVQVGAGLNLSQALAAGGVIRFQCPPGSVIAVTRRYVLTTSTLIDAGDHVTVDGHGMIGPMLRALQNVILRRLTIRNFSQKPPPPPSRGPPGVVKTIGRLSGSVLSAATDAELDHATIENSDFPIDVQHTATVADSVFSSDRGSLSLRVGGVAHVDRTRFSGNGGKVFISAGWLRNCSFIGEATGAVNVYLPNGPVEIRRCTFSGVHGAAPLSISQRSSRPVSQTVTIRSNTFNGNDGGADPGAISVFDPVRAARLRGEQASILAALAGMPPAAFTLGYNRFTGNRSAGAGGAISADLANTLGMASVGDLFVNNTARGDGGAVSVSGGPVRISHALLKGNQAGGRGAALAVTSDASALVSNSLIVRNVGASGTIAGSAINLINVTVADNEAAGLLLESRAAQAANVLLARNHPSDCLRVPVGVFSGGGMQSDGSCPGISVGEAFLDSFYVPAAGSPALRAGDAAFCRGPVVAAVDLAFQSRRNPVACALGAFEQPPLDQLVSKTDRPLVHATPADNFPDDHFPDDHFPDAGSLYPPSAADEPPYRTTPPYGAKEPANRESQRKTWWGGHRTVTAPPAANSAMNTVLAALRAEAAAPQERVRLFMIRGTVSDDYAIDRLGSRRFHIRVNPQEGGPEVIAVDGTQWTRTGKNNPWHTSLAPETPSSVPSMADLFTEGLAHPLEQSRPDGSRSITGDIHWTNGGSCSGKLRLAVDATGLPVLLRFDGTCDGKPLTFHQAFSFAGPLTITPPA